MKFQAICQMRNNSILPCNYNTTKKLVYSNCGPLESSNLALVANVQCNLKPVALYTTCKTPHFIPVNSNKLKERDICNQFFL